MPHFFNFEDHPQSLKLLVYIFEHLEGLYVFSPKSIALLAFNFLDSQLLELNLLLLNDVPFNQKERVILVLLVNNGLFIHHALHLFGILTDPLLEKYFRLFRGIVPVNKIYVPFNYRRHVTFFD